MRRRPISREETAIAKKARATKYRAVPTVIDGIRFDSRAEAYRYSDLLLLLKAGKIQNLAVHPVYELLPKAITPAGVKVRAVKYEADFSYTEVENGKALDVVEDVKGMETPTFRLKMNLFLRKYPQLDLRIVKP